MAAVPDAQQAEAELLLGITRLLLARQRGNLPAVAEEAQRLQAMDDGPDAARPGLGEELRALALISLGSTEFWAGQFEEAERHLEQGVALARRIGRPYLEFTGLVYTASRVLPVGYPGGRAQQAGRRAGRAARLDRRACRWFGELGSRNACWCARGGRRRQNPGSGGPNVPSEPKPSPRRDWLSVLCVGCSSWRVGRTGTHSPPSRPATGWPGASPNRA